MLEHSEVQVIRGELADMIKTMTSITGRLDKGQVRRDTDRRTKEVLQDRIVHLEGELKSLHEENGRMKVMTDDLERGLDVAKERDRLQVLEIERLIDQRDDALERLEKVQEVFNGIFHDKQATTCAPTANMEGRCEYTGDAKDNGKQRVSWASTRVSSPNIRSEGRPIVKTKSTSSSVQSSPTRPRTSSSGEQSQEIRLCDPEEPPEREWYIETEKPPTTAPIAKGPFQFTNLVERLRMSTGDATKLEELSDQAGPRLYISKNCLFIFDPMWLELREHTCWIDWSERHVHDQIKEYLHKKTKVSAIFHIFSFPLHKNGWFYLGPHTLQFTDLLDVWPQLRQEEKQLYVSKMKIRSQDGKTRRSEEEIIRMAESGKLTQTTIEVWGACSGDNVTSFVKKLEA